MNRPRTVLVGAGHLAWQLGKRLYEKGFPISQVYSRSIKKAEALASLIASEAIDDLNQVQKEADWYILAVSDDALESVAGQLKPTDTGSAIYTHTSGATSSEVLSSRYHRSGVFYPLQTFSRNREVNFDTIPICIEASGQEEKAQLMDWGKAISEKVFHLTDKQRETAHLAAVFANNFSNFLYLIGEKILTEENISPEIIKPLILETALKVQKHAPHEMQTGPAKRGDIGTLEKHINQLKGQPEFQELYRLLSRMINPNLESF